VSCKKVGGAAAVALAGGGRSGAARELDLSAGEGTARTMAAGGAAWIPASSGVAPTEAVAGETRRRLDLGSMREKRIFFFFLKRERRGFEKGDEFRSGRKTLMKRFLISRWHISVILGCSVFLLIRKAPDVVLQVL
jgi:hypothetical protein